MAQLHHHLPTHQLSLPLMPGEETIQQCRHHAPMVSTVLLANGTYAHTMRCDDCGSDLGRWADADCSLGSLPVYTKDD
jgi:hypothetical protein